MRMLRWCLWAGWLILTPLAGWATEQAPDVLLMEGKDYPIQTNPLERYLEVHPERRPMGEVMSTGLWRGYIATWEIKEGKLFLKKVEVEDNDPKNKPKEYKTVWRDALQEVFPDQKEVVAEWFSGVLVLPAGELQEYVHMGYGSTYEKYRIIKLSKGVVSKTLDLSGEEFERYRQSQFECYKKTPEYKSQLADLSKTPQDAKETEAFLFHFLSEKYLSMECPEPSAP